MDLKAALARAKAELDEAEAQFLAAQERMSKLEQVRDGIQLAVDLYEVPEPEDHEHALSAEPEEPGGPEDAGDTPLRRLPGIPDPPPHDGKPSQVDLARAAMEEFGGRATTNEVRSRVEAAGYFYKYDQIRGALNWLEHKGIVKRP